MRALLFLLAALALLGAVAPSALAQAEEPLPAAVEEEPLESSAITIEAPVSPTLEGANGALLFGAMGAAFGAVIALGRYHKKRMRPIELGVLREKRS